MDGKTVDYITVESGRLNKYISGNGKIKFKITSTDSTDTYYKISPSVNEESTISLLKDDYLYGTEYEYELENTYGGIRFFGGNSIATGTYTIEYTREENCIDGKITALENSDEKIVKSVSLLEEDVNDIEGATTIKSTITSSRLKVFIECSGDIVASIISMNPTEKWILYSANSESEIGSKIAEDIKMCEPCAVSVPAEYNGVLFFSESSNLSGEFECKVRSQVNIKTMNDAVEYINDNIIGTSQVQQSVVSGNRLKYYFDCTGDNYVKLSLVSGSSTSVWRLYMANSLTELGGVYKSNLFIGQTIEVEKQDGYSGFVVFVDNAATVAETWEITITKSDSLKAIVNQHVLNDDVNIVCFGDSITELTDGGLHAEGNHYSDFMAKNCGANVVNVGFGGTQMKKREDVVTTPANQTQCLAALDIANIVDAIYDGDFTKQSNAISSSYMSAYTETYTPILERLSSIDFSKVDIVTILGGTNDWMSENANLGTSGSNDAYTTLGAMNYIVEKLLTKYPNLYIVFVTPTIRYVASSVAERTDSNWSDNYTKTEGKTLRDYSNAIIEEAKKAHMPCCDLYNGLGWTKYNFSQYFTDTDSTHPQKGLERIGQYIYGFMKSNGLLR